MDNNNNIDKESSSYPVPTLPAPNPPNSQGCIPMASSCPELNESLLPSGQPDPSASGYPSFANLPIAPNDYSYPMPSRNGATLFSQAHQSTGSFGNVYMNFQRNNILGARYREVAEIAIPSAGPETTTPPPTSLPSANNILPNSALPQMVNGSHPKAPSMPLPTDGNFPTITQEQLFIQGPQLLNQLNSVAEFLAAKGEFIEAIKYYEKITGLDPENGAAWTALGHCYLLTEELYKSFTAYQSALYSLTDVRDPQLWYGIGLLYDKVKT